MVEAATVCTGGCNRIQFTVEAAAAQAHTLEMHMAGICTAGEALGGRCPDGREAEMAALTIALSLTLTLASPNPSLEPHPVASPNPDPNPEPSSDPSLALKLALALALTATSSLALTLALALALALPLALALSLALRLALSLAWTLNPNQVEMAELVADCSCDYHGLGWPFRWLNAASRWRHSSAARPAWADPLVGRLLHALVRR